MPVLTNSIAGFRFMAMDGQVVQKKERLELIERDGVAGTGIRRLGWKGEPFQLQTINYVQDYAKAKENMDIFSALVGSGPVPVFRHSVDVGGFAILDAKEQACFAIFNSIGGIQPDPSNPVALEVCQVINWTLLRL